MPRRTGRGLLMPSSYSLVFPLGHYWFAFCSVFRILKGYWTLSLGKSTPSRNISADWQPTIHSTGNGRNRFQSGNHPLSRHHPSDLLQRNSRQHDLCLASPASIRSRRYAALRSPLHGLYPRRASMGNNTIDGRSSTCRSCPIRTRCRVQFLDWIGYRILVSSVCPALLVHVAGRTETVESAVSRQTPQSGEMGSSL